MLTPPSAGRHFRLRCLAGLPEQCVPLAPGQALRFGRSRPDVDVLLTHLAIGRWHFVITNDGAACFVESYAGFGSNRSKIELLRNGEKARIPAEGKQRLEIGDVLETASCRFRPEAAPVVERSP